MVSRLLLFLYIVTVSAQLISNQQENPGFTDRLYTQRSIAYRAKCVFAVSASETKEKNEKTLNEGNRRNQMINEHNRQRDEVNFNGYQVRDQAGGGEVKGNKADTFHNGSRRDHIYHESIRQKVGANFKENEYGNQTPKAFTNVEQEQHGKNVKYIERLKPTSQPDKIIVYDKVNYDREPFTNGRRPGDSSTQSSGTRREPAVTPGVTIPTRPDAEIQKSSRGNTSIDRNKNISDTNTTEGMPKYNEVEETTAVEIDLEDRVAFDGDPCPKGFAKVQGKCVKEEK